MTDANANSDDRPQELEPAVRFPRPSPTVDLLLLALGAATVASGMLTFRRYRLAIYPNRPARQLVTDGIYGVTRNPMYVGLTVAYLGGIVATGIMWAVALLPAVLAVIIRFVIQREERRLRERFPEQYAAYCARVRRWI